MRVESPLYVVTVHQPGRVVGGIQQHIEVFRQFCREMQIGSALVSPFQAPHWLLYPLLGVRRLLRGDWNARWYHFAHGWLLRYELRRRIDRRSHTLLYVQDPISAGAALTLRRLGWSLRITLVVHVNLSMADEWAGKGIIARAGDTYGRLLCTEDQTLAAVDELVFVSEYMRRHVNARIPGLDRVRQCVVHNAVYERHATSNTPSGGDLISIGGLEPRKNHEFLLRVLAAARAHGAAYTLTLVGGGPLRASLQQRAVQLGVADLVTFAGPVSDAAPWIASHRAYVHAARMESLGIVIIEALAAGKPVFAAAVGGIPELFSDSKEGRTWSLGDADGAAQMLMSVLGDPHLYAQMCTAARARYEARYTPRLTQPRLLSAIAGEQQLSISDAIAI